MERIYRRVQRESRNIPSTFCLLSSSLLILFIWTVKGGHCPLCFASIGLVLAGCDSSPLILKTHKYFRNASWLIHVSYWPNKRFKTRSLAGFRDGAAHPEPGANTDKFLWLKAIWSEWIRFFRLWIQMKDNQVRVHSTCRALSRDSLKYSLLLPK